MRLKVFLGWFTNLEGGLGGLMLGYVFGVHLSTFLSLLIPATSMSTPPLSSASFIPVYLLSGLFMLVLAGRYSLVALLSSCISGGFAFALGVSIIIHPSLRTRVVLTTVLIILVTIAAGLCLFIPALGKFKHPLIRFLSSSIGAFGVTMSISLLSSASSSWSSPYSHLYLASSPAIVTTPSLEWGTSAEKGFSALFCVLLLLGTACDWALWKKFGECPDEKWDTYLAEYAANLPNDTNRTGTFEPFASVWDRIFGRGIEGARGNMRGKDINFPLSDIEASQLDVDLKYPHYPPSPSHKLRRYDSGFSPTSTLTMVNDEPLPLSKSAPGLLKKGGRKSSGGKSINSTGSLRGNGFRRKEVVKFRPFEAGNLSDSDDDDGKDLDYEKEMGKLKAIKRRTTDAPRPNSRSSSTGDKDGEGLPDYSDFESDGEKDKSALKEQDIASSIPSSPRTEQWTPGFLKRHRSSQSSTQSEHTAVASNPSAVPSFPTHTSSSHSQSSPPVTALVPVPATPSLLNALDRVEKARHEAYVHSQPSYPATSHPGADAVTGATAGSDGMEGMEGMRKEGRGQRWEDFWREIREKGQHREHEREVTGKR
ncbi:hypothetical protein GYMLUDRAFT_34258 [Collybiopsis luxurians FD-317 M1]|nr:hypothetical protein GYMLUDRAFT_34258 [Collybiopsis luxurians FD-317 M1]